MDIDYSPVAKFYAGKSVFITGGAGFLGKVLLEKLLYSCPEVDKVYLLLRDKKEISAEQRLQNIINLPIFFRLKKERPRDFEKIVLLKGDISAHNLDMQNEDLDTVINKVSVVIHSAASIKFNDPLKVALSANYEGTENVLNLCHQMRNLKVFVYISTAFCNIDKKVIEEVVYPPPSSIEEAYALAEKNYNENKITTYLGGRPNTYTYTKALAEHLVSESHGSIPAVIIRPSIVTASKSEPVEGWVDNWFGLTGFGTFFAKGLCRALHSHDDHVLDVIPVDYVCNLTLVATARAKPQADVAVYNSCSGSSNPVTTAQLGNYLYDEGAKNNFNNTPFPSLYLVTRFQWLVKLITYFTYFIAYVADALAGIFKYKPRYTKLIALVMTIQSSLDYFTTHSWLMKTDRTEALYRSLTPADAKEFPFLPTDINWKEYMSVYFLGIQKYLLKEKKIF